MNGSFTTCALCGHTYSIERHKGCISCPLQPACNLICCPVCGFSDVDPTKSKAIKWLSNRFFNTDHVGASMTKRFDRYTISIADLAPGTEAIIADLGAIPETRRDQLMAYGIAPGRCIMVLQQNPATILQVDQTELAIENQVAQQILVETPHPHGGRSRGRHPRRWHRRRRHFRFLRKRGRRGKDKI